MLNKEWEDYIGLYERALKVKNQIIKTNSKVGGGGGAIKVSEIFLSKTFLYIFIK